MTYKLTPKTREYYDWDDIQEYICDNMGIETEEFREYHKVVGGKYKDLWHLWMDAIDYDVRNGSTQLVCLEYERLAYGSSPNNRPEWQYPFFKAVDELAKEVGEEIHVRYSW